MGNYFKNKLIFILVLILFLVLSGAGPTFFLGAGQTINNDLHHLTLELIASGIQFDTENNGELGFNTYAASPEAKAFAASVSQTGFIYAWGKG